MTRFFGSADTMDWDGSSVWSVLIRNRAAMFMAISSCRSNLKAYGMRMSCTAASDLQILQKGFFWRMSVCSALGCARRPHVPHTVAMNGSDCSKSRSDSTFAAP